MKIRNKIAMVQEGVDVEEEHVEVVAGAKLEVDITTRSIRLQKRLEHTQRHLMID